MEAGYDKNQQSKVPLKPLTGSLLPTPVLDHGGHCQYLLAKGQEQPEAAEGKLDSGLGYLVKH